MSAIIEIENLGKRYYINHQNPAGYTTLRDDLINSAKFVGQALIHPMRFHAERRKRSREEFWALSGVGFEVKQGSVVGIIGRNGAGKSTLLKILSRITAPTTGKITLRGRVASLLEVGTGFHPELTGRENIFLNGAILGMSRREIQSKFDEIVAFAEIEKFLDTPVKRYSSGMYVRLAFAVAAHLEPEILIVDEVLAVGDADFQKKCLGKMEDVAKGGRTILFVSHNMGSIASLCSRCIWLDGGQIHYDGEVSTAVHGYLHEHLSSQPVLEGESLTKAIREVRHDNVQYFSCKRIALIDESGQPCQDFPSTQKVGFSIDYECLQRVSVFKMEITLSSESGAVLLRTDSLDDQINNPTQLEPGVYHSQCFIPPDLFGEKEFLVTIRMIYQGRHHVSFDRNLVFNTHFSSESGNLTRFSRNVHFRPNCSWHTDMD